MGFIARHSGAPYQNGEVLTGPDLELDINNAYGAINGGLDNSNISPTAGIVGTKLADNTIPNAKMVADTLTLTKFALSATSKYVLATASGTTAIVNSGLSTSYFDVEGIVAQGLTPGNVGDLVVLYFQGTVVPQLGVSTVSIRFDSSGTPSLALGTATVAGTVSPPTNYQHTVSALWAFPATATSVLTIKPQYSNVTNGSVQWSQRLFLGLILPVKV